MSPSNSLGHESINDDNSHADHALDDQQYETNMEVLRQRREELDRQLQALERENMDVTSRSGGSLDRDAGSTSSYAAAERNNIGKTVSTESQSTNHQPYHPNLQTQQSSGYSAQMPTTDESLGQSYPQRQQTSMHQITATGDGSNVYAQNLQKGASGHTHTPSSQSLGSVSVNSNHRQGTESFNSGNSLNAQINTSYPFPPHTNPYDQQFLAAAATAFHQQQLQQQQQATITSAKSGTTQQKQKQEEHENSNNTSMLWKLLQDKEDEIKEVRQLLRDTQQKFQEQSLLATKLQTTLDQVQEAFEKERQLIKLKAEKEAQESLSSRLEEVFEKQLRWVEDSVINKNENFSLSQQKQSQQSHTNNGLSARKPTESKGNIEKVGLFKEEQTISSKDAKVSERKHHLKITGKETISRNVVSHDVNDNGNEIISKNNTSDKDLSMFTTPSNSGDKKKLYPSLNDTLMENGSGEMNKISGKPLSTSANREQDIAEIDRTSSSDIPHLSTNETTMANKVKNTKHSMNESMSSDRFDPVYVAQNMEKDVGIAKDTTYLSYDDDKSLGHTIASSTHGDDRMKVVNKKLLDPYGDKGTYTGVVLRNTGMPHGLGRMIYEEDRRVFEGDWRHGRWHGYGRASFSNGDSYEGEYKFDQRHGTGMYRWNDGRVYDGQFLEDKRHGRGVFTWPDGAVYEGDFVNGQRQGHGKYTFADGGQYEGSWKDGRYDGFGTCTWEDGRRYRGEWRNGMAHGRGTETYPNGNIRHEGEWIDDEPIR
mmetsp:Transcript_21953/g.52250  ORF Transcript_21953/g.52250 Transcript_21953/m.52250 type:complete len:765 (-) Transcript_21953:59-2353(-)